jgi:hypothetical protein
MQQLTLLQETIEQCLQAAVRREGGHGSGEATVLQGLALRTQKLRRAWDRPQAVGLFGPSQAGKSFLVGALLAHEMGSLAVQTRDQTLDFLKEINPAKGVESTGVVTRFTQRDDHKLRKGDFVCRMLSLEVLLESMATGFLVECTAPAPDAERVERALRDARMASGPAAPARFAEAWKATWHDLGKKYKDRHAYLSELRRSATLSKGDWIADVRTVSGWLLVFSLLWGGPGHAPDLDAVMRMLVEGLITLDFAETVEVPLAHVRASSDKPSIIDAGCLNAAGHHGSQVPVFTDQGRDVTLDPGVLSALIAEIRLFFPPVQGSLLDKADVLDFPGGRALKGINGFGKAELSTGKLEHAIEVYKRGKLTFLFEQYALDREITALVLCSPGPTKPEAVQLQSQVENWVEIRNGSPTPHAPEEIESPSLFLAMTKFDMSLGALRSDNAKDRWEARVQEACIDFWTRSQSAWTQNWGGKARPFNNLYWIRNPYADQMQTLKPGDTDYERVREGYFGARAVERHIKAPDAKWSAVEGTDDSGMPRSGVPLLSAEVKRKLAVDVKRIELTREAEAIRKELLTVLRSLVPSRDEAEARARLVEHAKALTDAIDVEMSRKASGTPFGQLVDALVVPTSEIRVELGVVIDTVLPMSIKASDKVKKVLVHILKWWDKRARERLSEAQLGVAPASVDFFLRELCTSKQLVPVLGNALLPYFSRTQVDVALLSEILQVKIADSMLSVFAPRPRGTPKGPIRLSYSETASTGGASVDWSDVSFDDTADTGAAVVFAGRAQYEHWKSNLGEFYLKNLGGKDASAANDPHMQALVQAMSRIEQLSL